VTVDLIAKLVQLLRDAPDLGAIEVRRGPFGLWSSVRVSRAGAGSFAGGQAVVLTQPAAGPAAPPVAPAAASAVPAAPAPPQNLVEIKSPMVGTFYASPEPGAAPYVKAGSRVSQGQVVCIIEAMKIMNEIEAEVSGLIREVLVENAHPVEFGQPLFRVDPHG
jgi:acetyl-CoA carboxylase biotin carboxyl carrier protein